MKRIKTTLASLLFGAVASVGLADKINTKINNLGFEITEIGVANSDYETSVPRIYKEKVIWPGCNTTGCGIINYDYLRGCSCSYRNIQASCSCCFSCDFCPKIFKKIN